MLTKTTSVDLIEVVGTNVQVREATIIEDDGVELAKTYHRSVIAQEQNERVAVAAAELKAAVAEYLAA